MFLQIVFVAAVAFSGSFVNGQIETGGCNTYTTAVAACNVPLNLTGASTINYDSLVQTLTTDITQWCGAQRALYRNLIICVVKAYRACGTVDTMKLIAEGDDYAEAFDKFCNQPNDFSGQCVNINSITTCATTKLSAKNLTVPASTASFDMLKTYYCEFSKYFEECIKTNTGLTGCTAKPKTKDIYFEALEEIKPDECGAMSVVYTSLLLTVSLLLNYVL